jgi:predicted metal-dependent hydrolase
MGKTMVISDINIDVVKKDIKNMHLAVYPPHGKVRLATPKNVTEETIRLFTISKLSWIKKQQRKFKGQHRQAERQYVNRESHYFGGKRYMLRVIESDSIGKVEIKGKSQIILYTKPSTSVEQRSIVLNEWYRSQLKQRALSMIEKWEKTIGVSVDSWGIRQMKTKWGSCNIESKRILLNLELAKKPVRCLEYIIAHELIHLLERKHNDRFLALMNKFMPQWRTYKDELNRLPVSHVEWEY